MTTTVDEHRRIPARDGHLLGATIVGSGPRVVVVNSATAVPRGYYRAYAEALAAEGWTVVTYDYRGIGDSRPPRLRGFPASAADWALLDMAGVVDFATSELGFPRVLLVGHSIGGQLAGLMDVADRVGGMVAVSAQSGHWRLQGRGQRLPVALHSHLTLPVLARTLGYVPWSRFSGAQDLPAGAALQWARWCRDRRYLMSDASLPLHHYASFTAPVMAYSVDDDPWGTARSVDAMMSAYPDVQRRHLRPAEHGLARLGHFGFFRRSSAALWPETFAWLAARA
jgi:predicted alpha/beta hydrolase